MLHTPQCLSVSFLSQIKWISFSLHKDKLKRLELELEEEKSSVEMLTDRVARSRDQIDQLRSELMQERSSKQDLELDKNAMERHVCTYVISESIDVCDNQTEVFSLTTDTPLHLNLGDTLTHQYCCLSLCVPAAEGTEESHCRHRGSVSILSRSLPAGEQDSRVGRTTTW